MSIPEFPFAASPLAMTPAPTPDPNPIHHLLPPEPIITRPPAKRTTQQSYHVSEGNSQQEFMEVTLGNSPQFPKTLVPAAPAQKVTTFTPRQASRSPPSSRIHTSSKVEFRYDGGSSSRQKESHSTIQRQQKAYNPMDTLKSQTLKESSARLAPKVRNPRQDMLFVGDEVKKKFTTKSQFKDKSHIAQIQAINLKIQEYQSKYEGQVKHSQDLGRRLDEQQDTITELRGKIAEYETTNKTLGMQLQTCREKLKTRESENNLLVQQHRQLALELERCRAAEGGRVVLERDIIELRRINQLLHIEISKHKEQISQYEAKNEESLRLLKRLNQNISKREEKLTIELQEQGHRTRALQQQLDKTEKELASFAYRIREQQSIILGQNGQIAAFQQEKNQLIIVIQELKKENAGLGARHNELTIVIERERAELTRIRVELQEKTAYCQRLLSEYQQRQDDTKSINKAMETLMKDNLELRQQVDTIRSELQAKYSLQIRECEDRVRAKQRECDQLIFKIKELQLQLNALRGEQRQWQADINELKDEKRIMYGERDQMRQQIKELMEKTEGLYQQLHQQKQIVTELNQTIASLKLRLSQGEEQYGLHGRSIEERDRRIRELEGELRGQVDRYNRLVEEQRESVRVIRELEERVAKYERVIALYKEEVSKIKENKEVQWAEMKNIYENQITILEAKIKELVELQDNKRSRHMTFKVIEETTTQKHTHGHSPQPRNQ